MNLASLGPWRIHAAGAAFILLTIGAVIGLVIFPRLEAGAVARQAELTLVTVRDESRAASSRAEAAKSAALKLQTEVDAHTRKLGPVSLLNERVGQISSRAEKLGMRILELLPGNETVEATHTKFPIKLRAVGPASAAPELLRSLHASFSDLAVIALEIRANPIDSAEQAQRAQAQLSIDFIWFAERDGAVPVPAAK